MKKLIVNGALILCLILPLNALAAQFSNIVVFGDSLSDNGNLYTQTWGIIPDTKQYYQGRFSNGPVWVEYLANQLHIEGYLYDYAHGGASTDSIVPPGLILQVNDFLAYHPSIPLNTLFIIWAGANDFLIDNSKDYKTSADNIGEALEKLAQYGANDILVLNLPNLGSIPKMNKSQNTYGDYEERTILFNEALEEIISDFTDKYAGIKVYFFDIFSLLEDAVYNPDTYGFDNVSDVCPNFYINSNYSNEGKYLFWDDMHPTTEAHKLLSIRVADAIGMAVPDGNIAPIGNRDEVVNVGDALVALRIALGLEIPTEEDLQHGDVAPLNFLGKPCPDGDITVGDALVILRKALGIIDF